MLFVAKSKRSSKIALRQISTINGVTSEAVSHHFKSIIIFDRMDMISVSEGLISLPDPISKKKKKEEEAGNIYMNFYDLIK